MKSEYVIACTKTFIVSMVHINQPSILSAAMHIPCSYSGAYVNAKTAVHFTPLLAAIRYAHAGPVELLLEKGANVMVKDRLKYYNPIMWAVEIQSPQILKVYHLHQLANHKTGHNLFSSCCWCM